MNPGWHSLWILDGAKIHCDPSVVNSLRLIGVKIIFLPAYCPFFNPIEIMFGMVKKRMRRVYNPNRGDDILHVILDVLGEFKRHDFESIFRQCGYTWSGFDPATAFSIPFSDMHGIKSDGEEIWDVGDVGDYELTE
ncbi:Serine kinase [Rhizoclosmatium hyalinum]|nr:Serine kinase [Rhizoclosmatium hyalinum]